MALGSAAAMRPASDDDAVAAPFVSRLALEWAAATPERRWKRFEGTYCFLDLSGFTALSERLAKQGQIGAEELTAVLDHVFGELLDVAYEQAGGLLKFGGDAILLTFDGPNHAARACWAAIGMRARLRTVGKVRTPAGEVRLRMSGGLHTGSFDLFRVGRSHHELIVTGPAASALTAVEAAADKNEIVMSPSTAASAPGEVIGAPLGPGRALRDLRSWPDGPGPLVVSPDAMLQAPGELSVGLRSHLLDRSLEAEHRTASVAFIGFRGIERLLSAGSTAVAAMALEEVVSSIQSEVDGEGVTFLGSDIDTDGGKIILAAGVPIAQEDDDGRLLRAVHRILARDVPLDVRIGVNRGPLFAGTIGTSRRRTFTVIGDPVNVAARLMGTAEPGEAVVAPSVVERSRTRFTTEPLEPLQLKGRSQPFAAARLGDPETEVSAGERDGLFPFVGRQGELMELVALSRRIDTTGAGVAVELVGDGGSGKSRLLVELLAEIPQRQHVALRGESHGTATPHLPFRLFLRQQLPGTGTTPEEIDRRLDDAIARLVPDLAPWKPLLAEVMALPAQETADVARLDPRFRRERREWALAELVAALVADRAIVTVEDAQWLDDPSRSVLRRLRASGVSRGWLTITSCRTPGTAEPDQQVLELRPLSDGSIREMIHTATDEAPLRPEDIETLVARASGNPSFCEELVRAVLATGSIDALPDSIDAVVTARLDSLPRAERRSLRIASVLGMSFSRDALQSITPANADRIDDEMLERLGEFLAVDGRNISFRSRLVRDAAYTRLTHKRRRALHERAARRFEIRNRHRLDTIAEVLSMHYDAAGVYGKSLEYSERAADLAAAAGATDEAVILYGRAVAAAARVSTSVDDRASLHERLATMAGRGGQYELAVDSIRRAERLRHSDPLERARLLVERAQLGDGIARPGSLTRLLRRAEQLLDEAGTARQLDVLEADYHRATIRSWESTVRRRQGRHNEALALAADALELGERSRNGPARARALTVMAIVGAETGLSVGMPTQEAAEQIVEIYRQENDAYRVGISLGNAGGLAYWDGDWAEAETNYRAAIDALTESGCLSGAAFFAGNLGELLVSRGDLVQAHAVLDDGYRTLRAAADHDGAGFAAHQLARLALTERDLDRASEYLDAAQHHWETISEYRGLAEVRIRRAELLLAAGNASAAGALLATIDHRTVEEGGLRWPVDRVDALRMHALGHHDAARATIEASLADEAGGGPYERVLLLRAAHTVGLTDVDSVEVDVPTELRTLETQLGIPPER